MDKVLKLNNNDISALIKKHKSILRFIIVGCINTGVDFLTFTLLYSLIGLNKLLSQTGGYSMGIINSFIMNKLWTFKEQKSNTKTGIQFIRFAVINVISLGVSLVGISLLSDKANINVYVSKIIVTVFLQVFNYVMYKMVVFSNKSKRRN